MAQWIDFSEYGMELILVELEDKITKKIQKLLVLNHGEKYSADIEKINFKKHASGYYVYSGQQPKFTDFQSVFPNIKTVDMDASKFVRKAEEVKPEEVFVPSENLFTSEAVQEVKEETKETVETKTSSISSILEDADKVNNVVVEKEKRPSLSEVKQTLYNETDLAKHDEKTREILRNSILLGKNKMGDDVFLNKENNLRFFVGGFTKNIVQESSNSKINEGLFLRGVNISAMANSADAMANILKTKPLRFSDLKHFAEVVNDKILDDNAIEIKNAYMDIDAAVNRILTKISPKSSVRDVFVEATKFEENRAYVGDLLNHGNTVYPLPIPVALAIQRVLGLEMELKDKKVVMHNTRTGLFSRLNNLKNLHLYEDENDYLSKIALVADKKSIDAVKSGKADYKDAEFIVANLIPGYMDAPKKYNDLSLSRSDLNEVWESLESRKKSGRSIYVLRTGASDDDIKEFENFKKHVGLHYAIEGDLKIDGLLHTGLAEAQPMHVLVVGTKRPEVLNEPHKAALKVNEVHDYNDVWSWTSTVISNRAQIETYLEGLGANSLVDMLPEGELFAEKNKETEENYFQTPYVAMSKIGQASTMCPKNLEGAIREALTRVARKHGDIDNYVSHELSYTKEELANIFSPEQIDALALFLFAQENDGRAVLNADMTGIGKGRYLAGVMRWSVLNGKKVVFLTEKEINISDIFRDIRHIGSMDEFSPIILNQNSSVIDEDNDEVMIKPSKLDEMLPWLLSKKMPEDYNLIVGTYSQFNRSGDPRENKIQSIIQKNLIREIEKAENEKLEAKKADQENGQLVVNEDEKKKKAVKNKEIKELLTPEYLETEALRLKLISPKSLWMRHAIDKNTVFVLDESHNITSGTSNMFHNVNCALDKASNVTYSSATWSKQAKNLIMYRKLFPKDFDINNIDQIIRRGGETIQEALSSMLAKDGVMIRREHDLANCEFSMYLDEKNIDRNRVYMDTLAPIIAEMAYLSGDLNKRIELINEEIQNKIMKQEQRNGVFINEDLQENKVVNRKIKSLQLNKTSIGAPLYKMARLFIASLLADSAADKAIEALKNNRKPIILLENTVQSVLEEIFEQDEIDNGVGAEGKEKNLPDFKDLMKRTLRQLTTVKRNGLSVPIYEVDPVSKFTNSILKEAIKRLPNNIKKLNDDDSKNPKDFKEQIVDLVELIAVERREKDGELDLDLLGASLQSIRALVESLPKTLKDSHKKIFNLPNAVLPELANNIMNIEKMIDSLPDLPISVIDTVKDKIRKAGYSCDEITGRSYEIIDGRVVKREKTKKTIVKNRFNQGLTDALVINNAGTTGIDLHASRRFNDQRQRELIELQSPADINKQIQAYGRVNRFDQVIGPIITSMMTGLPAEARLFAIRNGKLRRLSASVTSNREHSALIKNIPDLINAVGDIVCYRYAQSRPDLMRRLGFEIEELLADEDKLLENDLDDGKQLNNGKNETTDTKDSQGFSNMFISRLSAMLPVALQEQVMEELVAEFNSLIQELDSKGTNPLKSRVVEGVVHLREKKVFDGIEGDELRSQFDSPVYSQKVIIERKVEPIRGDTLINEYEKGLSAYGEEPFANFADSVERNKNRILEIFLPRSMNSVEEAIAMNHPLITERNTQLDKLVNTLRTTTIGSEITLSQDGVPETGIVTRVHLPKLGNQTLASSYSVSVILPGRSLPLYISLGALLKDEAFKVNEGLNGEDYDKILKRFDDAVDGSNLTTRYILTGNEWNAMNLSIENQLGSMVVYQDAQGIRHRGILVNQLKTLELENTPVPIKNAELAFEFITEKMANKELLWTPQNATKNVLNIEKTLRGGVEYITVSLPSPKVKMFRDLYTNVNVQEIFRELNFTPNEGKATVLNFNRAQYQYLQMFIGILYQNNFRLHANNKKRDDILNFSKEKYIANGIAA
jgi:hypothetical protein